MIRVKSIWLACGVSDLRAGMDTLLARVVRGFEGGAQMNTAYVFANRGATRLKVLVADSTGLWLCTRRLSSGSRFLWPDDAGTVEISADQWEWLVAGAPWRHVGRSQPITVV
jgi:transposase